MEDYALPLWMYVAVLVVLVCGAMKRLLAPSLLAWLGATVLVERLWSVCLPAVLLLLILLAVYLYASTRTAAHTPTLSPRGKAVLITGCDSGFGKATAKHLDSLGLEVFATVLDLSGEGARELQRSCSARLTVLQVDITQPQQVQQALLDVKAKLGLRGLWGLVNNAGVCVNFGEAELSLMSNFRGCMEVNFFGTLNVTKSFLPLLRHTKGRVINISSPAGDLPFPCLSAYGASKAALNLLTDTLRHELQPWGVQVSTVQPSSYKTGHCTNYNYWEQQHKMLLQTLSPALLEDYGEDYLDEIKELFHKFNNHASTDFSPVVDAIVHGLLSQQPQTRYFAGPGLAIMYFINTYCPYSVSSRFLQRLFMKKTLAPRALRGNSAFNLNLSLHTNNNNNNEEESKLK